MLKSKIEKIRNKHDGGFFYNIAYEIFVVLYLKRAFRVFLSFFCRRTLPPQMVFLVGCYNSGTTIVRDIIRSHPEIGGMPREGVRFTDAFADMQYGGWIRMAYHNRQLPPSFFDTEKCRRKLGRDWGFWAKKQETCFLDKSITHSFRLPFLQDLFPSAKFVAITRDGYCSSEGVLRRAKPEGDAKALLGSDAYPVSLCAKQWSFINRKIDEFSKGNPDCYHFRFEDFVENPESTIRSIFEHIGVDGSIVSCENGVLSVGVKKFPIKNTNPESRDRFISRCNSLEDFDQSAADMMRAFGYEMESE